MKDNPPLLMDNFVQNNTLPKVNQSLQSHQIKEVNKEGKFDGKGLENIMINDDF